MESRTAPSGATTRRIQDIAEKMVTGFRSERGLSFAPENDEIGVLRDYMTEPAWESGDLGLPLPDSPHACSVCLPTWDSVLGYEEERDKVLRKLRAGYPRFFMNAHVKALNDAAQESVAHGGERVVVFATKEVAQRAQRFVEKRNSSASRIASFEGLQALVVSEEAYRCALQYWRFSGEVVSSRQAEDTLAHNEPGDDGDLLAFLAKKFVCSRSKLFLYESGMSSFYAVHRAVTGMAPAKKTLQLDFPYVDALKVQENFGSGVVFLPDATGEHFDEALSRIRQGEFAAVFCELPSNPLLSSVDLVRLSEAARAGRVPLVADDTVASHHNVDVLPHVDLVTTSLTKWISGKGDVTGGSVRVNPDSHFAENLLAALEEGNPRHNRLYPGDSRVLKSNAEGFPRRMKAVNRNGELLADFLQEHPAVERVWYPKYHARKAYDAIRRKTGGYGGLISFTLRNEKKVSKVYDALAWNKGPSLGTEFSLACPYTLLAHYGELDWAAGCGVPSHLLRLSAGVEKGDYLLKSLEIALNQA
ncbi:PLP-dependent transferase [Roseibacillus persicicus]|uniref:PLP-dependent transferase n=1 Tax=Roseibacillus persicicus TaxID=454148 RepID=UPI00280DC81D|nr:PLP-dependent transferase [Roseibacillus persicicus]MDQ8191168.1 PLP-dependent transferase [Roseibacillus persicicus]